ncbi:MULTISPECIES: transposase [Neomoorella]|uniref:Transposase n=2 Tax=Neomoorella TaxID=44260 RepID=A0A2T0ATK5_9FIRM|nr:MULTISPECIES: transposase [Moorella]AKX93135.1 transposase [Moorella thermoacetica]AKX93393.1 transposase [Moorella thermoacetica]AKX93657.1 transposase [Moorella thermoacetica]AKX94638.1 transposase [Moorella thermoacetica]AKX94896.1 transposase [Moorella thermoacetica]
MERRKFTLEFKRQVVEQAIAAGNNSVVARKYDIRPNIVSRWVRQYKAGQPMQGSSPKGNATHVTQQEHARLVAENRELDKQNTHLKQLLGEKDLEIAILRDLLKKANPHLQIK